MKRVTRQETREKGGGKGEEKEIGDSKLLVWQRRDKIHLNEIQSVAMGVAT